MENKQTQIQFFSTGYCTGDNQHIHKKGKKEKLIFHALTALIEHPTLGKIIFDTGYSRRFLEVTKKFPYRLYSMVTPVFYEEKDSLLAQLEKSGVSKEDINHLVISHFHADHIGGMRDFEGLKTWCTKLGLNHIRNTNKYYGVTKGYLGPLLPDRIQTCFPEERLVQKQLGRFTAWEWTPDCWFVELPGHAKGQLGLWLKNTNYGDLFLVADGSWSSKAIRERILPSRLVSVFVDSYSELKETIFGLSDLQSDHPNVEFIPTHCAEVYQKYIKNNG
jgi:glyoxylase-like metal-dependent hydrolase (beta-lactamase superfamily II)